MVGALQMSKEAKKEALRLRGEVVKAGLWPCCLNCDHWKETTTIYLGTEKIGTVFKCNRYNMTPPPETIAVGCIQHLQTIPF